MGKYKSKLAYTARDTSRRDIDNETEQNQIYYGELRTNGFQIAVNNLNNYF
jgi:hypothetical protein